MDKTVFILGAGFSSHAGIPAQYGLMKEVFKNGSGEGRLSKIKKLCEKMFAADGDAIARIPLEDIFTLVDRANNGNEKLRGLNHSDLRAIPLILKTEIGRVIDGSIKQESLEPYRTFAKEVARRRVDAGDVDKLAIISLNWDIVLDNILDEICGSYRDKEVPIAVDYCCYDHDYDGDIKRPPSSNLKARGFRNIKLLKLHGSFNWVYCKNCGRLFSKFKSKIALYEKRKCMKCSERSLESLIISPTLLKDLNNTHLKTVWNNALIDLMEADRVVFVGYSFPLADFEFRYLLAKGVKPEAKVRVVLSNGSDPKNHEHVKPGKANSRNKIIDSLPITRYENFFGNRNTKFNFDGAANFMENRHLIWDW